MIAFPCVADIFLPLCFLLIIFPQLSKLALSIYMQDADVSCEFDLKVHLNYEFKLQSFLPLACMIHVFYWLLL